VIDGFTDCLRPVRRHGDAGLLRAGRPQRMVRSGIRGRLCAGLGLRLPPRRMAVGRSGRNPGPSWPRGAGRGSIGRCGEVETPGNAEASHDLRATSKLLIQAAVLRRSVRQRVPFDSDVAPSAFDVVVGGGAAKFLAVQGFRPIFLGNLHARCSNIGGSMQRSQSPQDTKKCDDADTTLSVVAGSTAGEAGLLLVNRNRTTRAETGPQYQRTGTCCANAVHGDAIRHEAAN
jgi:hypothetical protein